MKPRRLPAVSCLLVLLATPTAAMAASSEPRLLTLDEAMTAAMHDNPQLLAARETLNASDYKARQARAGYLPQASASASYSRATSNNTPRPGFDISRFAAMLPPGTGARTPSQSMDSSDFYSASVNVNQTIYDFGRTGGAYDAARADERASAADVDNVTDTVRMNLTQAYFGVLASQELLSSSMQTQRQMAQHLALAEGQVNAGVRPMIDVTRAKADLANANLALLRAKNQLAMSKSTLNAVMGQTSAASDYRVERPQVAAPPPVESLEAAIATALDNRPDYKSLKSKVEAVQGTVTVAHSGYFPILSASGNLTYAGTDPKDLIYNWTATGTLTWNFFSGFATMNAVDEAQSRVRVLEASRMSLELSIRNEVETAYLAYHEALEKMAPTKAVLAASKETLDLAEGRYRTGAGNIVEVTDAQSVFTQAQVSAIAAEFDLEVARARLLKAVGLISST